MKGDNSPSFSYGVVVDMVASFYSIQYKSFLLKNLYNFLRGEIRKFRHVPLPSEYILNMLKSFFNRFKIKVNSQFTGRYNIQKTYPVGIKVLLINTNI